jgi:hypothetical protein
VRAIYHFPKDGISNNAQEIKFLTKNGLIIPFVELPFGKQAVSDVMIAPLIKDEIAKKTTEQFLVSKGYTNCFVRTSKIPIRF